MVFKKENISLSIKSLAIFLALALQVQITLFQQEGYTGLRVNLADLFLPFTGLAVLMSLILKKTFWPQWRIPFGYTGLIILSGLFTFSLINGYLTFGEWDNWALMNKYLGWFVLLSYFCLGGWLVTNFGELFTRPFFHYFICVFIFIALISIILIVAQSFIFEGQIALYFFKYPLEGLMANRNAYAFLFTAVVLSAISFNQNQKYISILFFLTPLLITLNGSRSGFVVLLFTIILSIMIFKKPRIKAFLPYLSIGLVLVIGVLFINKNIFIPSQSYSALSNIQVSKTKSDDLPSITYQGDHARKQINKDAIDLWLHSPIWGTGLGSALRYQEEKHQRTVNEYNKDGDNINVIHSTPLWILTEMGAIGFIICAFFFAFSLFKLFTDAQKEIPHANLMRSALLIMLAFGAMSLLHELLYTRFLWFFMGMAIALSKEELKKPLN